MKRIVAIALLAAFSVSASAGVFDWERAVSLYKQGQFREAIAEFQKVLSEFPDHADSWKYVGLSYYQLKEYSSAIAPLEKALEQNPKDGDSFYYLGVQQFRTGKLTDAIASLRAGLIAEPKNVEMLGLLTESLLRYAGNEPDEKKAGTLFDEATRVAMTLKSIKDDAAAAELLGRAYLATKRFPQAEAMLSKAIEGAKQPSAALYFNLGFALAQTKSWPRAAEMFANADKLNPNDTNTLYYLGYVYENQRRYPQALEAYTKAYEASGRSNADIKASIDRVAPLAKQ